nr:hypothetical protein [uncultured archaeon]
MQKDMTLLILWKIFRIQWKIINFHINSSKSIIFSPILFLDKNSFLLFFLLTREASLIVSYSEQRD